MSIQDASAIRRSRGRPQVRPDEETLRLIVDTAKQEFLTNCFNTVSMAQVAQRAGVSTKTMYRLVPTKGDLFRSVVAARLGRFFPEFDSKELDALPLREALTRLLTIYGELTLGEEATRMYRLAVMESTRFPEIATAFFQTAIEPTGLVFEKWLSRQAERGLIQVPDVKFASEALRGMMALEPQRAAVLKQKALPNSEAIALRARRCADLFLKGCVVHQPPPSAR